MQRRISAREVKRQVQTQTEGLIIKSRDINENDTVVKILTGDLGLISAFANGTKKVKSRTASAAVSPMTYSRLTLYRGRESYIVDDAKAIDVFFGLREDIEKLSLANYFCELAGEFSPENTEAHEFLSLTLNLLHLLSEDKRSADFLKPVGELRMLALAGYMREKDAGTQILFVGAERGLERDLIAHTDYPFRTVNISSFHRSFRPAEIRHNLVSLKNLAHAEREANAILNDFHPDLIVGTGGYASYPLVRYGAKAGIPTAVHESNIVPGLTTRQLEPHCDRIMVGFEDCRAHYKHPEKVVVTGTPVRGDFFTVTKQQAKEKLGMNDGRKLIVSFWGSLGSNAMNRAMAEFLALESAKEPFYHIHGVGEICWKPMQQWMHDDGLEITEHPALDVREYIYDMATVMRAADLVICRAGASTLSELTALGVPAILVPSPNVTNHHQEKNAALLGDHGAALVLPEEGLDGKKLFAAAAGILNDPQRMETMSQNMAALGIPDATKRIYDTVMTLLK